MNDYLNPNRFAKPATLGGSPFDGVAANITTGATVASDVVRALNTIRIIRDRVAVGLSKLNGPRAEQCPRPEPDPALIQPLARSSSFVLEQTKILQKEVEELCGIIGI